MRWGFFLNSNLKTLYCKNLMSKRHCIFAMRCLWWMAPWPNGQILAEKVEQKSGLKSCLKSDSVGWRKEDRSLKKKTTHTRNALSQETGHSKSALSSSIYTENSRLQFHSALLSLFSLFLTSWYVICFCNSSPLLLISLVFVLASRLVYTFYISFILLFIYKL